MVILFVAVGDVSQIPRLDPPALIGAGQIDMGDRLVQHRHLQGQLAAGVQCKGAAVEHLIVLPAHQVEVNQRQSGLHHAGHHHGSAACPSCPGNRATRWAPAGTRPRSRPAFRPHPRCQAVFANGRADAHVVHHVRSAHRAGCRRCAPRRTRSHSAGDVSAPWP